MSQVMFEIIIVHNGRGEAVATFRAVLVGKQALCLIHCCYSVMKLSMS